jgi:uncharacterized repeat protein (TIGR01451 family)
MHRRTRRHDLIISLGMLLTVFGIGLALLVRVVSAVHPNPAIAAWERVKATGSYHFTASVVQTSTPRPTVANVGRSSTRQDLHLEGATNLADRTMQLRLWSQDGSAARAETGLEVQIEDDRMLARQGAGDWQEIDNFAGALAPEGDFLTYLAAVRDLRELGTETRAGMTFTRYTFSVDGPRFAAHMREQLEQRLARQGKLPPGVSLDLASTYADMTGSGELWISQGGAVPKGLPLRQTLDLRFPDEQSQAIGAQLTVDFSNYGASSASEGLSFQWPQLAALAGAVSAAAPTMIELLLAFLLAAALVRARSRRAYAVVAVSMCVMLVAGPLLQQLKMAEFGAALVAQAAEQKQRQGENEYQQAVAQAQSDFDPHANLLEIGDSRLGIGTDQNNLQSLISSHQASAVDNGADSDGDKLTDWQEIRIGTVFSNTIDLDKDGTPDIEGKDSDSDGLADNVEVKGFAFEGKTWYTDPIAADSNGDELDDRAEWGLDAADKLLAIPLDIDQDKTPDLFDLDNDGDGVSDEIDLSPNLKSSAFTQADPFGLTIKNLNQNAPTYVEFQLRPTNPRHLWYAFNVLDWPDGDMQGNLQDGDGATFKTLEPGSPNPSDAQGDMKLVPMLEIRIAPAAGARTNLPLLNTPQITLTLRALNGSSIQGEVSLKETGSNLGVNLMLQGAYDGIQIQEGRCDALDGKVLYTFENSGGLIAATTLKAQQTRAVVVTNAGQTVACANIPLLVFDNSQMVDMTLLRSFGISIRDEDAAGNVKLAYVPLQLKSDRVTQERAAFMGRMFYQAPANVAFQWPKQEARLIWAVEGLVDMCQTIEDNQCVTYAHRNMRQVIQTYPDDWFLTGLEVREDHGTNLGIIYEDPLRKTNDRLNTNDALTLLAQHLNAHFLSDSDLTIDELQRRFDYMRNNGLSEKQTWGIGTRPQLNIMRVEQYTYPHRDAMLVDVATQRSKEILNRVFNSARGQTPDLQPLLLFARRERYRPINLETPTQQISWINNQLTVDFFNTKEIETAAINWIPYHFRDNAWQAMPPKDFWDAVALRYPMSSFVEFTDAEERQGQQALIQLYHLALYSGSEGIVRVGAPSDPIPPGERDANLLQRTVRYLAEPSDILRTIIDEFGTMFQQLWDYQAHISSDFQGSRLTLRQMVGRALNAALVPEQLTTSKSLASYPKLLKLIKGSIVTLSLVLFVAGMVVLSTPQARTFLNENLAAKLSVALLVGGLLVYVGIIKPALLASHIRAAYALSKDIGSTLLRNQVKGMAKASLVMSILVGLVMIGIFTAYIVENDIKPWSFQFSQAMSYLYASLILLVILTFIGIIPIVGPIIVGVYSLVDFLMSLFHDKSLSDYVTEGILYVVYSADLMIDVQDVSMSDVDLTIEQPLSGIVPGNTAALKAAISTTVAQRAPAAHVWQAGYYAYLYNQDNLRSTAAAFAFDSKGTEQLSVARGTMTDQWDVTASGEKYLETTLHQGVATTSASGANIALPEAGLNRSLPVYLNYGYALPAINCWTLFLIAPPIPICYTSEFTTTGSTYIGDSILLDVLPPTLDQLYALSATGDGSYRLGWDERFTALADADGDGLLAQAKGGLDPDDQQWDSDGDRLPDSVELKLRQAGVVVDPLALDRDGDGLNDADELRAGTAPDKIDSDGDGLPDKQELDGWTMTVTGTTTLSVHVTSDPLSADGDQDGTNDRAEYDLRAKGFSPSVFNPSPIAVYPSMSDADGVLRPGQTFVYTTTVRNTLGDPLYSPALQVDLPAALGGGLRTAALALNSSLEAAAAQTLAVGGAARAQTAAITSTVRVRTSQNITTTQWVTTPSSFQSGTATRPPFAVAAAPARPDGQDRYLLTTLMRSSESTDAWGGAPGDIKVQDIETTAKLTINRTVEADEANGFGPDSYFWRTKSPANIACANNGNCLIVWDHQDHCFSVNFQNIYFASIDDHNTSTVEPMLFRILPDGNRELLFSMSRNDSDPNLAAGGTVAVNQARTICGQVGFELRELDGSWPADGLAGTDLVGSTAIRYDADSGNHSDVISGGNGNNAWHLRYNITPFQRHASAGVVIGPTGNTLRGPFSLTGETTDALKDRQPAVASDGTTFLVTWARATGSVFNATDQLWMRRFDSGGNSLAVASRLDDKLAVGAAAGQDSLPDVIWAGDRYLVAWQQTNVGQSDRNVAVALLRDGQLLPSSIKLLAASAADESQPHVAYNSITRRAKLVYQENDAIVAATLDWLFGSGNTSLANRFELARPGLAPRVAFDPVERNYIVGWRSGGNNPDKYVVLAMDDTSIRPASQLTWRNASSPYESTKSHILACPATQSAPQIRLDFEEPAGSTSFVDSSGSVEAGTCSGPNCPLAGAFARASSATNADSDFSLAFDGVDDYVRMGNPIALNQGGRLTVAAWVKPQATDGFRDIVTHGYTLAPNAAVFLRIYNGSYQVGSWDGTDHIASAPIPSGDLNQWVHLVGVYDGAAWRLYRNGAEIASKVDSVGAVSVSANWTIGARSGGTERFFKGQIDDVAIYRISMPVDRVKKLYNESNDDRCLAAASGSTTGNLDAVDLNSLAWRTSVAKGGMIQASASLTFTIDAQPPKATITSLKDKQYLGSRTGDTLIIGGSASDNTAVAQVEVRVDGGAWQKAEGTSSWAFSLPVGQLAEGLHQLEAQATDVVGLVGPAAPVKFFVDRTAPTLQLNQSDGVPVRPTRDVSNRWTVALSGAVFEPKIGSDIGSGITLVEVLLAGQNGATGNGWQPAWFKDAQGGRWDISYILNAAIADPTGIYTARVRVTDRVGNQREIAANLRIDTSAPVAQLTFTSPHGLTANITQTVTIGGVITDTGAVASGIAVAEVAFVPAEQVVVTDAGGAAKLALPFDEPANATRFENLADLSSPGNCAGASCPAAIPGRAGQARSFDGVDDYVSLGNPAALSLSGQVTIAAWVKPQATNGIRNIVAHGFSAAPRGEVFLRINEGRYQVGSWNGVDHMASATIPSADLNQWVHLTGVYDGAAWRLYRNGVEIANKIDSTGAVPVNAGWAIGARGISPERLFKGQIDEVAIYSQALSGEQVRALMRAADVIWYPAQLAQTGKGISQTSWSVAVPADLEGSYQIDVRGTDVLGNRNLQRATWNVWRGEIDTRAPRVSIVADYQGGGATSRATYTCAAQDFTLDESSFVCPGVAVSSSPLIKRTFYDSFWWRETVQDPARLYGLQAIYTEIGHAGGTPRVRACDRYGHCAEAQGSAAPANTIPSIDAAIVAPPANAVLGATAPISVTAAAAAQASLRQLDIMASGQSIASSTYPQATTISTTLSANWQPPADTTVILQAVATDWNGRTFKSMPVTVTVEMQPPAITIDTRVITSSQKLVYPAALLSGSASGAGPLDVQVQTSNGVWVPAAVQGNTWKALWYLGDEPDGRSFTVTARVTDGAKRTVTTSAQVLVDVAPPTAVRGNMSFTDSQGRRVEALPNQPIGQAATTLAFGWEPATDGSGLAPYRAGWSNNPDVDPATLQVVTLDATREVLYQAPAISGTETLYAHLILRDVYGNERVQTFGPVVRASGPSLGLSKTGRLAQDADGNGLLSPGDTIEWSVKASNTGTETVRNWTLTDTLDRNTTLVGGSAGSARGTLTVTGDTISLSDVALAPGDAVTLTFRAVVKSRQQIPASTLEISNQASIGADNYARILSDDPATDVIGDRTRLLLSLNLPPDTSISAGPPQLSLSSAATFGFAGVDDTTPQAGLTFECRVDGGFFTTCANPQSYTGLADGQHTFEVRAVDAQRSADPSPASYTWTIVTSCANAAATITGTANNDTLTGTPGTDIIFGLGGHDIIDGQGGDDLICGGEDHDTLTGGPGNDIIDGGIGQDRLDGGEHNDRLIGGEGHDELKGGSGEDVLDGGVGQDRLDGGEHNDRLTGGDGHDELKGGSGEDVLDGGVGQDRLDGGEHNDRLIGGDGHDELKGGSGADSFSGGPGNDTSDFNSAEGDTKDDTTE